MKNKVVAITFVMLSCWQLFSCAGEPDTQETAEFRIVATTGMIADAAAVIAGETAQVSGLMGPGVDPHLYKPTHGDIQKLAEADLLLYNGLHLEGKMQEVLEKMEKSKAVVAVSSGIAAEELLYPQGHAAAPDPHIWFDVSLWQKAVTTISQAMQAQNPQQADLYQRNTAAYLQQLDSLHAWVQQKVAAIPAEQRVLITAHDAFGYFGRAYDVEVKGLQGISTLAEYGLLDIQTLVHFIVDRKIPAVFVESSVSEKALEAVVAGARERGQAVKIGGSLFSDAMGPAGSPEGTYLGMVRHNVSTIAESLNAYENTSN